MRELYFSTVLERFALLELSPSVNWTACGKRSGTSTEEKLSKEPVVLIAAVCTWISPIISARRSERAKKVCWRQAGSCYRRKAIWWWSSICCLPCTASAGSSLKVRALQTLNSLCSSLHFGGSSLLRTMYEGHSALELEWWWFAFS